jgi:hypothetical protein
MKKLFFLLLLLLPVLSAKAQTDVLYSWYNYDTYDYMFAQRDTIAPPCMVMEWHGSVVNACATTALVTGNWAKPRFNPTTHVFYNAATPAEQEIYEAQQQADATPADATSAINNALTTPQTDAQINALYPNAGPAFILFCPYMPYANFAGSGTVHIKGQGSTWNRIFTTPNNN